MHLSSTLISAVVLLASRVTCAPVEHNEVEAWEQHHVLHMQTDAQVQTHARAPLDTDDLPSLPVLESPADASPLRVPSRYESTVLGRRLLALSKSGVLTTVFPENVSSSHAPEDVARTPIGLPDYIAACEEPTGNPTLLALTVSTSTKNALAGSNASLTLSWWDAYVQITHKQPWSAANLPRLSLTGYLEEMTDDEVKSQDIAACFTKAHGDSQLWLPGRKWAAHKGMWMRLVVKEVYWIGGFGDRNYIGWFDSEEWQSVKAEEWMNVKLPGEK